MLTNVKRLIHRTNLIKTACDAMLMKINKEDEELRKKQQELQNKLYALEELLSMKKLDGSGIKRSKIYELLRKISVIQQQITVVCLENSELGNRRQELAAERNHQLEKRKIWWLKEQKYERLKSRLLQQKNMLALQQEEAEQEEKYNGQNFKY
ncbi:TPA: type III secretion protein [Yersinia enterocolitica]|nr:type III secretion protein [Yersinia enterocolitica]